MIRIAIRPALIAALVVCNMARTWLSGALLLPNTTIHLCCRLFEVPIYSVNKQVSAHHDVLVKWPFIYFTVYEGGRKAYRMAASSQWWSYIIVHDSPSLPIYVHGNRSNYRHVANLSSGCVAYTGTH